MKPCWTDHHCSKTTTQGCQLPDFSLSLRLWDLRLFDIFQTSLLLFYICLKPRLFCTFHHKTTSKHPRIQEFWLYFEKNSVTPDKNGKSAFTQLALPVPGQAYGLWPAVKRTLSTSQSFQTFLEHNVGNPFTQHTPMAINIIRNTKTDRCRHVSVVS